MKRQRLLLITSCCLSSVWPLRQSWILAPPVQRRQADSRRLVPSPRLATDGPSRDTRASHSRRSSTTFVLQATAKANDLKDLTSASPSRRIDSNDKDASAASSSSENAVVKAFQSIFSREPQPNATQVETRQDNEGGGFSFPKFSFNRSSDNEEDKSVADNKNETKIGFFRSLWNRTKDPDDDTNRDEAERLRREKEKERVRKYQQDKQKRRQEQQQAKRTPNTTENDESSSSLAWPLGVFLRMQSAASSLFNNTFNTKPFYLITQS